MNSDNKAVNKMMAYLITVLSFMIVLYTTYKYTYAQMLSTSGNDINVHVYSLISIFRSGKYLDGWMAVPHCLWHITVLLIYGLLHVSLNVSAAYASCIYAGFYYIVLVWFINRIFKKYSVNLSCIFANLIALSFSIIQPLYFSFLDAGERYMGVFSMNPLHNPTHMGVRGFALLSLCLVTDIVGYSMNDKRNGFFFEIENHPGKYYGLLTVMLFLSVVMKPTFAEMFIPAVGLYMLGVYIVKLIRKDNAALFFKKLVCLFLCALPAVIYILLQYVVFFIMGGSVYSEGGMIVTGYLEVWSLFTDNVYLSVLLGMSVPILLMIIDLRYYINTTQGQIAVISYIVGFIEAAFLGEDGSRLTHANFMWPMMAGMLVMWLVSLWHLLELSFVKIKPVLEKDSALSFEEKVKTVLVLITWGLYIAHVIYGITYYNLSFIGL